MISSRVQPSPPTVDVVIPVYNGSLFIQQAIESVTLQTFQPTSIIIVDDGSTDTTSDIVQGYNSSVPLVYIRQENRGLSSARNAGWQRSQAEFVAFLDADDIWLPEKLAAQVNVYKNSNDPSLNLVYCAYHHINGVSQPVSLPGVPIITPQLRGRAFEALLPMNIISSSGSAVLIRRDILKEVGGFDESLRALEDWDMWLRIAQQGTIDFVNRDLVGIRTHVGGMQKDSDRMLQATIDFIDIWLQRLPATTPPPKQWVQTLARYAGNSWPPMKFWQTIKTRMSLTARLKLFRFIRHEMELYAVMRLASMPLEWIIRRPWKKN